jgi:cob(I)alamin adenosyltransferase
MLSGEYDLIILDEIFVAVYFGLTDDTQIQNFIRNKPDNAELVLTGRYASDLILRECDLVTEMRELKHYYSEGVLSRKGIDC